MYSVIVESGDAREPRAIGPGLAHPQDEPARVDQPRSHAPGFTEHHTPHLKTTSPTRPRVPLGRE